MTIERSSIVWWFQWKNLNLAKGTVMEKYQYITLREKSTLKETAAQWFHSKWRVSVEAYLVVLRDREIKN